MASLWRVGTKLSLLTAAVGGGTAAALIATSDDPKTALKLTTTVPRRLFRDAVTAANIAFDYEYSLWGVPEGSTEREKIKHEVHLRSAQKLQELCFKNGGIYIKLGQHLGQLEYLVPEEYVTTMRNSMLNRCPVSSYEQICEVFEKEFGETPDKVFAEFDPVPIASASLAQVHVARTHDGKKVAVKVQHTHLTDTAAADNATVEFIVNTLHKFFPNFDYRWLIDEINDSLPKASYFGILPHETWKLKILGDQKDLLGGLRGFGDKLKQCPRCVELDFLLEAKNSEKCLENFRKLSPHIANYVYAPKVYWNLSTSKLLTMEFMDGVHVNDVKTIQKLGINPHELSILVSQTFAEMMFKHGFVHCDPHAANLLVRPLPSGKRSILGRRKPQLILLDHGLYKELDFDTRTNYAALWKALIFSDANSIKEYSLKLGAGEDLYALFAGILTMRPWNRVVDPSMDHLVIQGDESERSELQMYASEYVHEISDLLRRLPRVILLMLKTNDCLRAVNNALFQGSSLETFFIIGKVSSKAVIDAKMSQSKSLLTWFSVELDKILLELRFWGMQIALWLLQIRKSLSC
ncbi:hypothetical protein Lal_00003619 [Lupinus albus]|nr:hypothetical protein Lal_00003619 [Lupinus albus]